MTVLATVPEGPEGAAALAAALAEARALGEGLVVLPLGLREDGLDDLPEDVDHRVLRRLGREGRDPVEVVLGIVAADPEITRVVIGLRRRSRLSKAVLGSISQRILLECPVPVLAVKTD